MDMTKKAALSFTKEDTLVMKGIAVILMLDHHLFLNEDRYGGYGVQFFPLSEHLTAFIAKYGKICVGVFAFITAYGLTLSYRKMMEQEGFSKEALGRSVYQRIIKLLGSFWVAYAITLIGSVFLVPFRMATYGEGVKALFYGVVDFFGLAQLMGTPTFIGTWWYVSLALVIILLMPLLLVVYDKIGVFFMTGLFIVVPRLFGASFGDMNLWLLLVVWGIWFADQDMFGKLREWKLVSNETLNGILKFLLLFVATAVTGYYRGNYSITQMRDITNCTATILFICFCYLYVIRIPVLRQSMKFIGKYSMNMYFLHNCLFMLWFKEEFYAIGNCWVILAALVVSSLLLSILVELLKKAVRYDRLIHKLENLW